jgi:hypothetical protein
VIAIYLLSATVWLPVRSSSPEQPSQQPSLALPGVAAVASVGILPAGNWLHVSRLAIGLTVATLTVAGLRT